MITLRNLQIFERVAECGKMSMAAKELYISQSAVSQVILEIEHTYNILLFERIGKRLYLTETGKELLHYAHQVLAGQSAMEDWLLTASQKRRLRIGATLTIGSSLLWPILEKYHLQKPTTDLQLYVDNTHVLEGMLLVSELDIAIVEGNIENDNLIKHPVMKDCMVLICGCEHPFWGHREVSLSDLNGQALALREEGSGTRAQLVDCLRKNRIQYKVSCICRNIESIRQAVVHNHGLSYISQRLVQRECEEGLLWACQIRDINSIRTFDLVWHRNKRIDQDLQAFMLTCTLFGQEDPLQ